MSKKIKTPLYVCIICDYKITGMNERELIAHIQTAHYRVFRKSILKYGDRLPYLQELISGSGPNIYKV